MRFCNLLKLGLVLETENQPEKFAVETFLNLLSKRCEIQMMDIACWANVFIAIQVGLSLRFKDT